ncbi:YpoC family protein [Lederbergia citrisecunda]|uniref:YpoC family protein n=2 Tax=Bacillales TaxID=1385 RepID=UPI003D276A53
MDRKELFYSFWNCWLDMKEEIGNAYKRRDPEAAKMMDKAIENYLAMLGSFLPIDTGSSASPIEPLNGKERLQFIHSKRAGHFAYVQLDALYTEAMKKTVSRFAMKK